MNLHPRIVISRRAIAIFVVVVFMTISLVGGLFFQYLDGVLGHGDQRWIQVTKLFVVVNAALCLGLLHRTYRQPKP